MKYALIVSYDGTDFCGWQKQGEKRTVQLILERAASEIFGRETRVIASGRTDSGVHALGQVRELAADTGIPADRLSACFNGKLPADVRVLKSFAVENGFDVTRSAKRKTYRYTAYYAETELPLLERYAVRLKERPSMERMKAAAELLVGEHDFAAFRAAGYTSKTSVRTLYGVEVDAHKSEYAEVYTITVCGNGFLYNMVRILAGEIFAVGCGKETKIIEAFETGERCLLAKTMPAKGLVMLKAEYAFERGDKEDN